jgi:hypothetical protein
MRSLTFVLCLLAAPAAAQEPSLRPRGMGIEIHVLGDRSLTLHEQTGIDRTRVDDVVSPFPNEGDRPQRPTSPAQTVQSAHFEPLCTAPCDTLIRRGRHRLGISRGEGAPIAVEPPIILTDGATLNLWYDDNLEWEIGGGVAIGLGVLAAGIAFLIVNLTRAEEAGAGVAIGGILSIAVGIGIASQGNDQVGIDTM